MVRLFHALAGNATDTARFLGIVAGSVPVAEFMDPVNLGRLCAEAA